MPWGREESRSFVAALLRVTPPSGLARKGSWACLLGCAAALPAFAAPVSGVVTNRTTGRPAPGDVVALIAFEGGMQVAATTNADEGGRYSLEIPSGGGTHLLRVSHQKATYFQPIPQGAKTVDVDVFDVAPQVEGIRTEADVLSMQSAPGAELEVREDYFVRNDSAPPRTQLSERAYEFYLPEGAKLEGSAAMGPGGAPVDSTPVPLPGNGHYAFVFPVRPGRTQFQVTYTLPYSGHKLGWTQREALPTDNLVLLLPKTMRFAPDGTGWQPVPANTEAQTFVRKGIQAGVPVAFGISGEGQLPREAQGSTEAPGTGNGKPGGGLGVPIDTPDPLARYKGWLLGGLGLLLAGGAAWLIRVSRPTGEMARGVLAPELRASTDGSARALRPALEQTLLALEREHALGAVDETEYLETRAALQKALHRALAREAAAAIPVERC